MNQQARDIARGATYGTLGTVDRDGFPRATILRFAFDEEYLYWRSMSSSEHAKNSARDDRVSIAIYDSSQQIKGGVYISSQAEKLDGDDRARALRVYSSFFEDYDKLGADADMYRCRIGEPDTGKTDESRYYFVSKGAA